MPAERRTPNAERRIPDAGCRVCRVQGKPVYGKPRETARCAVPGTFRQRPACRTVRTASSSVASRATTQASAGAFWSRTVRSIASRRSHFW